MQQCWYCFYWFAFAWLLRFILSLASCKNCIVIDDQLNILPISSHVANITPVPPRSQVSRLCQLIFSGRNLSELNSVKDLKKRKLSFHPDWYQIMVLQSRWRTFCKKYTSYGWSMESCLFFPPFFFFSAFVCTCLHLFILLHCRLA